MGPTVNHCFARLADSFEMVLALDKSNGQVHRFDGAFGTHLGAFGAGLQGAKTLSLNQSAGEVIVWDAARGLTITYNYNTGLVTHLIGNRVVTNSMIGYAPDKSGYAVTFGSYGVARRDFLQGSFTSCSFAGMTRLVGSRRWTQQGCASAILDKAGSRWLTVQLERPSRQRLRVRPRSLS